MYDDRVNTSDPSISNSHSSTIEPDDAGTQPTAEAELTLTKVQDSNDGESRSGLTPEQEHRRQALQSMLATSNARYQQAIKKRGPVFAAGINVKINTGSLFGKIAVVLDADYIESRALISVPNQDEPLWLPFTDLGLPD